MNLKNAARSHKKRSALLLSLLFTTAFSPMVANAQTTPNAEQVAKKPAGTPAVTTVAAPVDTSPWLYKGSDIPQDKGWQFGTLQNGLRYAVRKNGVPPGQVAIRVRIDAGSLMEEDKERGYAHFLEHLLFRGSKYVQDGEAKRIWERLGATFGSDSNAQTSPTQTIYQLDLPNATAVGLEESIKILSGMVREPKLDQPTIDTEKSVIMAEQRESDGPQQRQADASREHVFAGQRLAARSPIGTSATIAAATAGNISAFHERWYRPDRVVVAISGDGDPAQYAALVNRYFGDWRAKGAVPSLPSFGTPVENAPVAKAVIEPTQPMVVTYTVARPWTEVTDSIVYTQGLYLDYLANQLINRRLENRARNGGSYLLAQVSDDKISRSAHVTSVSIVPLNNEWEKALRDVRGVIADALDTPPSQADIEREFAVIDTFLTKEVENRQNEPGAKQVDDMMHAIDIRETLTDPTNQRWLFRSVKDRATPQALLEHTRKLFSGKAVRAFLSSPTAVPNAEKTLAVVATEKIKGDANARLVESKATFDDLPKLGATGKIETSVKVPIFDMDMIRLSNGVTALVYNSDIEPEKVRVNVRFGGGRKALSSTGPNLLWTGPYGLSASGIGKLKQNDLDRITNGRQMDIDFGVDDDAFELRGETNPKDLRDQMRLLAAQLSSPAWNPEPVHRIKASELMGYSARQGSAVEIIKRDLEGALKGGDKRWTPPTKAEIDSLTPDSFRQFWQPLLASGPVEVEVFGDLKTVDINALLTETFGALPARSASASANSSVLPLATGKPPLTLTHKGDDNQAAAVMAWPTGGGLATVSEGRALTVLAAIFNDRVFERMRQEQGASYAPQAASEWPESLNNGGNVMVVSLLQPKDVAKFFEIARGIAAELATTPPTDDEVQRATGPLKEQIVRASSGNMFWMLQLEGATTEPKRFDVLRNYLADIAKVSPADVQRMAKQYLNPKAGWTMQVLPEKPSN